MAFGLERILTAMDKLSIKISHATDSVLLYPCNQKVAGEACEVAHLLRTQGAKVNYCPQILDEKNAIAYAKHRGHSVVIGFMGSGKYFTSTTEDNSQELSEKYGRLLHSVCG
jgi:histidyl-tRNA synthetase